MTLYPKLITDALATVIYPGTKKNLIESEMLADTPSINGMKVKIVLIFPRDTDPFLKSTLKAAEAACLSLNARISGPADSPDPQRKFRRSQLRRT